MSRFLFEDNVDFSSISDFPIFESVETNPSPSNCPCPSPDVQSQPSITTSPTTYSTPSPPANSTPSPNETHATSSPTSLPAPATSGPPTPSAHDIASYIGSHNSTNNVPSEALHSHLDPNATAPMEKIMAEMLKQNKRMEDLVGSMHSEIQGLKQEVVTLKNSPTHQIVAKLDKGSSTVPGTALWSVNEGVLLEFNERFCNIVELKEIPAGYRMHHFFGGPCSNAAKSRMNQHLSNLQNSQPATDYAVVERKKLSGEVMRLMIVVNVIPTPLPVFLTVIWEL